jgi:hypothetical protein
MKRNLTKQERDDLGNWLDVWAEMTAPAMLQEYGHDDAIRLCEISTRLHHLYEVECSYPMTRRQETRMANLEKEAQAIADKWGLRLLINGDPRGLPLGLYTNEKIGRYNSADGQTWRIPML